MNPTSERPNTRAKNVNQHPGLVGRRQRRTKKEIEEEKAMLRSKKPAEEEGKKASIAQVAVLEDRMAIEDYEGESAHPRKDDGK